MRPLCLSLLVGCAGVPSVAVPVPRIHAPIEVDRPGALTNALVVVSVRVSNSGLGPARVHASVTDPFTVPTATFDVPASGEVVLPVVVRPSSYDAVDGTLVLNTGLEQLRVALHVVPAYDWDADGHTAIGAGGDDCDDRNPAIHPGAIERCDGVDQDCNDQIDDDAADALIWHPDADGDRFGDPAITLLRCAIASGIVADGTDCDDTNAGVHPGAAEVIAGVDDDCDGRTDETSIAAQDLMFSELMIAPSMVINSHGQFAEITNRSGRTVDLTGFHVVSSIGDRALTGVTIDPGGLALLCTDTDPLSNGGIALCDGPLPQLGTADRVVLNGDATLDSVDYTAWAVPRGASLELRMSALAGGRNDAPTDWCAAIGPYGDGDLGTPGFISACP